MALSTYTADTHSPWNSDRNAQVGNECRTNDAGAAPDKPAKTKLVRITTVPISLKVLLRRQLQYMSGHFDVLAVSTPGEVLAEVSSVERVRTAGVAMTRAITPVQDLKALWRLYCLFRKERPAIVHTHTPKAGLLGMMAARLAAVPIRMHTVAGLPLMEQKGMKRKVLELVERLTYGCATRVYPNSTNLARFILNNRFCTVGKVRVLGNGSSNGIDTEYFQCDEAMQSAAGSLRDKMGFGQHDFVYVFIGRLVKDKGIEELVAAFSTLQQRYGHLKLLLVGPYEEELDPLSEETKASIQQNPAIVQVGFQQDIRLWLLAAQVLVFPSYREGFPNVPMQAGCMHLPSIVTDINGCNEIIQDRENGLVIPAKDRLALQQAMELVMTDGRLLCHMQSRARSMITARYDQQLFWDLLLREYKDQLKQHGMVS
ncbi:glycosyltransferase family 4 protein [Paraflavitalea pollutisoli]|uniref:glycosyltransferase family 4 protein n=1 Tax=Paraflavitalea pollutisoli TaxID=3034143 RepID=UPI0023ED3820|nr:glycosyltransferase family 4 protein [Paraflavitalea sp. H1-2-19X]